MAKKRRGEGEPNIKLKQPDRSGPTEKTLLRIAEDHQLFQQAEARQRSNAKSRQTKETKGGDVDEEEDTGFSPRVEQLLETTLWTISLAMLHFTLDTLVQHQYAIDINWLEVISRAVQAFLGISSPTLSWYPQKPRLTDPSFLPPLLQPSPTLIRP